jgi:type IV pilus assembly protein PilM
MGDEPIWRKEVSFGREPEPDAESETRPAEDSTPDPLSIEPAPESKETLWKREISFEKTPAEEDAPAADSGSVEPAAEPKETLWKREISLQPTATPTDEPSEVEETQSDPLWTRAISYGPKSADEHVVEPQAEEPVDELELLVEQQPLADVSAPPAAEDRQPTPEVTPDPEPDSEPWNVPPTMPPAVEVDVVHPPVPEAELPLPAPDEAKVPFWKKDISFGGKKSKKRTEAEEPEPVVDEVKVPFWKKDLKKDLSFRGKKGERAVEADEPVSDEPKVPFWKKDLSFGGKKREKTPQAESVETVGASEEPAAEDERRVPFWKKDLSFGGKKREKTSKPKAERKPKEKAEKKPKEPKAPKPKRAKRNLELGSRGAKRLVGLKIGASQLAAAKVSNNGTAELQQVARGPLEAGIVVGGELRDPDALSEALKAFFSMHRLPKRGVRLGIANNRIGVRTFEITGIEDPKQLANAVRFRAQEALPIPIDEAVLDYQVLSEGVTEEGEPTRRILLVVAYRELIDRYVDACKKAGITLTGIDLEAFALLRALQAPQDGVEGDPTAALVAVAIGHERATFAVSDGRVCEFTRVLDWGGSALNVAIARVLDAAPSEVEGAKRALALTDEMVPEGLTSDQAQRAREAMRRGIQAFARELVSSLQYYQNQPGSLGIGEIVLTGGTAHLPGLAGELERLIGVRVRVGDPLARMKIAKKVGEPEQLGSLAVAIGLGIED